MNDLTRLLKERLTPRFHLTPTFATYFAKAMSVEKGFGGQE